MPVYETPIQLNSLDSRSDQVRVIGFGPTPKGQGAKSRANRLKLKKTFQVGRALDMRNVDIEKANEVGKRKGYVRRLTFQLSGPVRLLHAFPGLCGRAMQRLWGGALITLTGPATATGGAGAEGGGAGFSAFGLDAPDVEVDPQPLYWFEAPVLLSVPALAWRYAGDKLFAPPGCVGVRILRSIVDYPTDPNDEDAVVAYDGGGGFGSGPLHGYDGDSVRVKEDQTAESHEINYYSAWADYGPDGYHGPLNATSLQLEPVNSVSTQSTGTNNDDILLQWLYFGGTAFPAGCVGVRILHSGTGFPTGPDDPNATLIADTPGALSGSTRRYTDETPHPDAPNFYGIWADYGEFGYSEGVFVEHVRLHSSYSFSDDFNRADEALSSSANWDANANVRVRDNRTGTLTASGLFVGFHTQLLYPPITAQIRAKSDAEGGRQSVGVRWTGSLHIRGHLNSSTLYIYEDGVLRASVAYSGGINNTDDLVFTITESGLVTLTYRGNELSYQCTGRAKWYPALWVQASIFDPAYGPDDFACEGLTLD